MCGITGFWDFKKNTSKEQLVSFVQAMADNIKERGPDSSGIWVDETLGLAFGHRRLSIVDLSPAGHQPMISHSGHSILSYNGEIFNAPEIKQKLIKEGCQFRGYSDTEVILEACEKWGVVAACQQFIGMFAFSFWDKRLNKLFLVRDRLGIKPLYWGINQGILFFGSQLKSFAKHPAFQPTLNKEALTAYFRFNYVPTPLSIFEGFYKQTPGTVIVIDEQGLHEETPFWTLKNVVQEGIQQRQQQTQKSDHEWITELDDLIKDAVARRMVADVPLGAFLSGGIDSSTVVAIMQAQSSRPIKTFSIGFQEQGYNEAHYAAKVAKHLNTEHHEWILTPQDAYEMVPSIPHWFDEPFADVSQIPTFLVSRLARQFVTVSLSGDGGDELFAGYNRYFVGLAIWQRIRLLPYWLRCMGAYGIQGLSVKHWDKLAFMIPKHFRPRLMGDKAYKFANILKTEQPLHFYRSLVSHWDNPTDLVQQGFENFENNHFENHFQGGHFLDSMQMMDTLTYLPDDILTKVDRASMAVSLEARVPLLDHRLVEFAWRLPQDMKIRERKGKWLLRQVLNRYIPQHLIDRPKMGFGVPIHTWLRGPLQDWCHTLLSEERLKDSGLNPDPIRQRWQEHLSGVRDWQYSLWGVLMFQAWHEHWKSSWK